MCGIYHIKLIKLPQCCWPLKWGLGACLACSLTPVLTLLDISVLVCASLWRAILSLSICEAVWTSSNSHPSRVILFFDLFAGGTSAHTLTTGIERSFEWQHRVEQSGRERGTGKASWKRNRNSAMRREGLGRGPPQEEGAQRLMQLWYCWGKKKCSGQRICRVKQHMPFLLIKIVSIFFLLSSLSLKGYSILSWSESHFLMIKNHWT